MSDNLKVFLDWNEKVLKYPPSEIFFGEEQTPRMAKAEKRLKELCDFWVFSFENEQKNNFRVALWDLKVLINLMSSDSGIKVTNFYIVKVINEYVSKLRPFMGSFEAMIKADQILQEYYKSWRLSRTEIMDSIMSFAYNYSEDRVDLNNKFKGAG